MLMTGRVLCFVKIIHVSRSLKSKREQLRKNDKINKIKCQNNFDFETVKMFKINFLITMTFHVNLLNFF